MVCPACRGGLHDQEERGDSNDWIGVGNSCRPTGPGKGAAPSPGATGCEKLAKEIPVDQELDRTDSSRAWWQSQLAGLDMVLDLPADGPRGPARGPRLERAAAPVGGRDGCLARLDLVAARPSREVDTAVLLTGVAALCVRLTGRSDLALGTTVPGPGGRPGLAVVRLQVRTGATFGDLLGQARDRLAEAARRGPVPPELAAAAPSRDGHWHPFTQVVVTVRARGEAAPDPAALRLLPDAAPFDLAWILDRTADPASLLLEYEPARYRTSAPVLLRDLQSLLARGLDDPGAPLVALAAGSMPVA